MYENFSFLSAGVFCAIVSHPADTLVSKLNQAKGRSMGDIVKELGFMGWYLFLLYEIDAFFRLKCFLKC